MNSSTRDKAEGKFDQAKGEVKEKIGQATGDQEMQDRGTVDKVSGKVQEKVGDIKKVFEK